MKKNTKRFFISSIIVMTLLLGRFILRNIQVYHVGSEDDDQEDYMMASYLPLYKPWTAENIKADHLTHLHIAFGLIGKDYQLTFPTSSQQQLEEVKKLREQYPDLKLTIAIGGWGADGFSDMALVDERRTIFCDSVGEFLRDYHLDGVDIDWEFPVNGGWGTIQSRTEDKPNFTLLMKKLRETLDVLEKETNEHYELSFACSAQKNILACFDIKNLLPYVDYVNLMGYDFSEQTINGDTITSHHTNLYSSKKFKASSSVDDAYKLYMAAGIPAKKIVLGFSTYGWMWNDVPNINHGLFQKVHSQKIAIGYTDIKNNYLNQNGFIRYWDEDAKVSYLFNETQFITYEDSESVAFKMDFVKEKNLRGAMCWEYLHDNDCELMLIMHEKLSLNY